MARIPFSVNQLARAIWSYIGGAAGTAADRAVNTTFWNGTAVTAPNTAGTPVVDVTRWNGTVVTAPNTAGTPVVDVVRWNGTAVAAPDTAGYPKVTLKDGTGVGELLRNAGFVRVIKSIQYNDVSITTNGTSGTRTLGTTVTAANAVLLWLGQDSSSTDISNHATTDVRITLTSGTTVTATRQSGPGNTQTVSFCVVEFYTTG